MLSVFHDCTVKFSFSGAGIPPPASTCKIGRLIPVVQYTKGLVPFFLLKPTVQYATSLSFTHSVEIPPCFYYNHMIFFFFFLMTTWSTFQDQLKWNTGAFPEASWSIGTSKTVFLLIVRTYLTYYRKAKHKFSYPVLTSFCRIPGR